VLGQCKAEKKKLGPGYVRELEGVVYRHVTQQPPDALAGPNILSDEPLNPALMSSPDTLYVSPYPTVALLISESPFTRLCLLAAHSSPVPLFLLHLPSSTDIIGAAFWNPALASARGVLRGEVEMRWEHSAEGGVGRPGLWWRGQRLVNWVPDGLTLDASA